MSIGFPFTGSASRSFAVRGTYAPFTNFVMRVRRPVAVVVVVNINRNVVPLPG